MCSDKRQEFILFSDTLGVSMVVDLINHRKPDGATESTVFGPFHRLGAPEMPAGGNIARRDKTGTPTLVSGRVLDLDGKPIAGAVLDVWQTQTNGLYDSQDQSLDGAAHARQVPHRRRGPLPDPHRAAGQLPDPVRRPGRRACCARPAATRGARRTSISSCRPTATSRSRRTSSTARDEYLGSDAVFAVKESLICDFVRHEKPDAEAAKLGISRPLLRADFDFRLTAATSPQSTVMDAQRRLAALGAVAQPLDRDRPRHFWSQRGH